MIDIKSDEFFNDMRYELIFKDVPQDQQENTQKHDTTLLEKFKNDNSCEFDEANGTFSYFVVTKDWFKKL